ncbi:MAG: hypothetical protein IKC23_12825 [Fibrobacter sp.]|nr:hypothetical protein [Fibrobacter sp.]
MKLLAIFAAMLALCTLCSCNDIECIGDEGHEREVFAITYVHRNYECKDGSRYMLECGFTTGLPGGTTKSNDCSRKFTTKDKLIKMNAKER